MNIDQRLDALIQTVESLTTGLREMQTEMIRLDRRERKGREALLGAILAYLRDHLRDRDNGIPEASGHR